MVQRKGTVSLDIMNATTSGRSGIFEDAYQSPKPAKNRYNGVPWSLAIMEAASRNRGYSAIILDSPFVEPRNRRGPLLAPAQDPRHSHLPFSLLVSAHAGYDPDVLTLISAAPH